MDLLERMPELRGCYFLTPAGTVGRCEDSGLRVDNVYTQALARPIAAFIASYQRARDTAGFRVAIVHTDHADKPWQSYTLAFDDAVLRQMFPVPGAGAGALTGFQQRNREKSLYRGMELLLDYRPTAIHDLPHYCPVLAYRNTRLDQYLAWLGRPARARDSETPVVEVVNLFAEGPLLDPRVDDYLRSLRSGVVRPERRSAANLYLMDEARPSGGAPPAAAPVSPPPSADPYVTDPSAVDELLGRFGATRFRDWDYGFWLDRYGSGNERFRFSQQLRAASATRQAGIETLRGFDRMKDFDPQARQLIAAKNPVLGMPAASVLLDAGSSDAWNLYLLSGEVELTASDGQRSVVSAGSAAARRPLALLKPRQYTVVARTPVQFLWLYEPMVSAVARLGPATTRVGIA